MNDEQLKINDGGQAFPAPVGGSSFSGPDGYTSWQYPGSQGMTLWDYYAAAAMTGDLASQSVETGEWTVASFQGLAERAAMIADAILVERTKRGIGR